jgi:hypothetical protein
MGTLQDELLKVGLAKAQDYEADLKFWDLPPQERQLQLEITGLYKKLGELRHKIDLLTPDEYIKFFILEYTARTKTKQALENLIKILEQK